MRRGQGAGGRGQKDAGAKDKAAPADINALFQVPLAEFTAARNALAAQLKKEGDSAAAGEVKALPKPSVSAWVVNQLYWRHRKPFDQLIDTGEKFRQAQAAQLAGKRGDVRGTLDARREALGVLAQLAAGILRESDHPASPDMMRRVTSTLEALATYGRAHGAPTPGQLTDDIEPPGFETLASLVPRIGREGKNESEPMRVLPFQHHHRRAKAKKASAEEERKRAEEERTAQLAAAKRTLQDAERSLSQARKAAEKSEAALKGIAGRVKETERERAAAEKVFEKVAALADAAKQEARRIASEAEEAAQAVEDAERDLEKARRDLKALES